MSFNYNEIYRVVSPGPYSSSFDDGLVRVTLGANAANDNGLIRQGQEQQQITASGSAPNLSEYDFTYSVGDATSGGPLTRIRILANSSAAQFSSALDLRAVSHLIWWRQDSAGGERRVTAAVFGFPTKSSEFPATGTAQFAMGVRGYYIGRNSFGNIFGNPDFNNLQVNYATRTITMSIAMREGGSGSVYPVNGSGTYDPTTGMFDMELGPLADGSYGMTGRIRGRFYGRNAREIGLTVIAQGRASLGPDHQFVATAFGRQSN